MVARAHFEAFKRFDTLVTQRGPVVGYGARIRTTLNPFLKDPDGCKEPVDAVLRIHSLCWITTRLPSMQRMVDRRMKAAANDIAGLARGDAELQEMLRGLLDGIDHDRGGLDPHTVRRALDGFLLAPDLHAQPVDLITEAHSIALAASELPMVRPLLRRSMTRLLERSRPQRTKALAVLRQRVAVEEDEHPVRPEIDFGPVGELPLPTTHSAYAAHDRNLEITATVRVSSLDGFRLKFLTAEVTLPDAVRVLSAAAMPVGDGSTKEVVYASSSEHVTSGGRGRKVVVVAKLSAPLVGLEGSLSSESKDTQRDAERRAVTETSPGVRFVPTRTAHGARFEVKIEEGGTAPGEGGLAFVADLSVNALVPAELEEIEATCAFDIQAEEFTVGGREPSLGRQDWYRGSGTGHALLQLPPSTGSPPSAV